MTVLGVALPPVGEVLGLELLRIAELSPDRGRRQQVERLLLAHREELGSIELEVVDAQPPGVRDGDGVLEPRIRLVAPHELEVA
jgi:hypothetical protein